MRARGGQLVTAKGHTYRRQLSPWTRPWLYKDEWGAEKIPEIQGWLTFGEGSSEEQLVNS